MINILRHMGTDYALIDHGPQRQWVKHNHDTFWIEPLTVFFPDGLVFVLEPMEIEGFFYLMEL